MTSPESVGQEHGSFAGSLPATARRIRFVPATNGAPAHLVDQIAHALDVENVRYCQWKGAGRRERWMKGEGDVDLLIDRNSSDAFARVMARFGFKLALADTRMRIAGVQSFVGVDVGQEHLIHIHAYFRLVLGQGWRSVFHPGVEVAVLDSAERGPTFKVPSPAFEYILFVLQETLKHSVRDAFTSAESGARSEAALGERARPDDVAQILEQHFSDIDTGTFTLCVDALSPRASHATRQYAQLRLMDCLRAGVITRERDSRMLRLMRRAARFLDGPRAVQGRGTKQLASGGAIIALVGTDGSGKSTCAAYLSRWLGREFRTLHLHLGLPTRSFATLVAGGALKLARRVEAMLKRPGQGQLTAHLELLRCVCTARDRYRMQLAARLFASSGGLVICERYPLKPTFALVGPSRSQGRALAARGTLASALRRMESDYYERMITPDLTLILEVDSETAVRRKRDEPEAYVRARAEMLLDCDWSGVKAQTVDARRPFDDVIADLRMRIWRAL